MGEKRIINRSSREGRRECGVWGICLVLLAAVTAAPAPVEWLLVKSRWTGPRAPHVDGVCEIALPDDERFMPSFVGDAGYKSLRLKFRDHDEGPRTFIVKWTPGETGVESFSLLLDGREVGRSRTLDAAGLVMSDFVDVFRFSVSPKGDHVLEIRHESGNGLNFRSFLYSDEERPLPPGAVRSKKEYEKALGGRGIRLETQNLVLYAPSKHAGYARKLVKALDEASLLLNEIHGGKPPYRISVEHFPKESPRGFGGVSTDGVVSYPIDNLNDRSAEFLRHKTPRILGYVEEMCHIYNKGDFYCRGTYEALGMCVSRHTVERAASCPPFRAKLERWRRQEKETFEDYVSFRFKNPGQYEWGIFYTRILVHLLEGYADSYQGDFWKDFFSELRKRNFPLQKAHKKDRLDVYARIMGALLDRDIQKEWRELGIRHDGDKPWGWKTYDR